MTNDRQWRAPPGAGFIFGRNPVLEALKSERPLNKIYIQKSGSDGVLKKVEAAAKNRGVPLIKVERGWLDRLADVPHQGVAAQVSAKEYCDAGDIVGYAKSRAENSLIVVADGIYDPQNLGSIIRSAEVAGAHGVIIPKRNAAGLTSAVARASAGAIEYMRVARVANTAETLRALKTRGLWIIGADAAGKINYSNCDMTGDIAVVIGGEDTGLGRLVRETCDFIVSLPVRGKITSLNASAAVSVILYEALRQRA